MKFTEAHTGVPIFEVPKIEKLPGNPLEEIPTACHFILNHVFAHEQSLLQAEHRLPENEVVFHLRPRTDLEDGLDARVVAVPAQVLHSLAARLALTMEIDHSEGGHGRLVITREGNRRKCRIFLSNCRATGCWIRIYARGLG